MLLIPHAMPTPVVPRRRGVFSLQELQTFVDGYIEAVRLRHGLVLFVNEEGHLRNLPYNDVATAIAHASIQPGDWIAGTAVLCTLHAAGEGDEELDATRE